MCGIALPTLRPDTLCGRFSMMGKVERHPHIDITYFSLSVIRLSWMCLSWWVFNLLDTQSTENNTFDESFLSYEKYEFWGELFLLNYSICIAYWAADNVFFFLPPGQMSQPFGRHEKLFSCGQPGQDHLPLPSQEVWCQDLCLLGPSYRPSKSRGSKVITPTLQ